MNIRDAIRLLRAETGMTRNELSSAVHVSLSTVNRWENSDLRPTRDVSRLLMELAWDCRVSADCLGALDRALFASNVWDTEAEEQAKPRQEWRLTAQFKAMIEHLDIAVLSARIHKSVLTKSELLYYNARLANIYGYEPDEFAAFAEKNPYFSIEPGSIAIYVGERNRLVTGEIEPVDFRVVIKGLKKDSTQVLLEVKAIFIQKFSVGYEICLSCRDITDGKACCSLSAHPAVDAELYRDIIDHTETAILIAECRTRRIVFANRALKNLFNIDPYEEITGQTTKDVMPSGRPYYSQEEINALASDMFTESGHVTQLGLCLRIRSRRIDWNGSDAYISYVVDETERRFRTVCRAAAHKPGNT